MNCEAVDELLAAYALDAVDADERAAIEAHLATCDRHEEVGELMATAAGISVLAEEREPSVALEVRLLDALEGASSGGSELLPIRRRLTIAWPAAAAAAVILLAAGFGAGALMTAEPEDEAMVQVVQQGTAWMRAEAQAGESPVKVTLAGLRRLPEGTGYQVWAVRDPEWVSVGVCNTDDDGWWDGDFDFALQDGDALAVTVEPRTGSDRPTGEVVLSAKAWERTGP